MTVYFVQGEQGTFEEWPSYPSPTYYKEACFLSDGRLSFVDDAGSQTPNSAIFHNVGGNTWVQQQTNFGNGVGNCFETANSNKTIYTKQTTGIPSDLNAGSTVVFEGLVLLSILFALFAWALHPIFSGWGRRSR